MGWQGGVQGLKDGQGAHCVRAHRCVGCSTMQRCMTVSGFTSVGDFMGVRLHGCVRVNGE